MRQFSISFLALLLISSVGCSFWQKDKVLDYRTVVDAPARDSELAKKRNSQAIVHLEKGQLEKAENYAQESLIADVTYGPAHNTLGKVYYMQERFYFAAWEFEYAIKVMPERGEPYNNLGLVYESVGKLDEAIPTFEIAVAFDANNPEYVGNLVRAKIRRGDTDAQLLDLLEHLVFVEVRPDWVQWAKKQLTFIEFEKPEIIETTTHGYEDLPPAIEYLTPASPIGPYPVPGNPAGPLGTYEPEIGPR